MTHLPLSATQRRPVPRLLASSSWTHPLPALMLLIILTAVLVLLGARFGSTTTHIAIGAGNDERALVFFGLPEQNATDTFRWTYPLARLFLYGLDGRPALLELRAASPRPPDVPSATLAPEVQGRAFGPFPLTDTFRRYRVLVPGIPTRETVVALQGSYFHPGAGDPRELGVALSEATVTTLGSPLLAWRRLVFLLTLPLLGWLLVWRLGGAGWLRFAIGLLLVAIAGVAAAFPFTAGRWLPLIWWPWWPLVPLLVLGAAPAALRWLRGRVPWSAWVGLGVIIIGLLAARFADAGWIGMAVALAGVLVALADVPPGARWAAPATTRPRWLTGERLALLGITLAALALRLYHLDTLPLGLWRDEARHGLVALRIWNEPDYRPVYVVNKADLPALLFYLMAPVVGMFGPEVWSARLASALVGGLTPLALWWAARPILGARAALLGAALLAWASWSLSMSRWAFPATLDQLLTLAAIGLMWRALDGNRSRAWRIGGMALAGMCAGLAAYSYHTGRFTPLILAMLTAFRLGTARAAWRRVAPGLAAALLVGLLVLLPLLQFIARDYAGYSRRVDLVALLNSDDLELRSPVSLLARNAGYYLLMWHVSGEWNGRHHAPNAPMLDPLAGALLLVGAGLALRLWRQPRLSMLLAWLALALLPGLFSTDAPHAMRSLPALAPTIMLAGLGFDTLLRTNEGRIRWIGVGLASGMLGCSMLFNGWLYFVQMPNDQRVYSEFEPSLTAMARVARAPFRSDDPALRAVQVFLPAKVLMQDPVRYLCYELPVGLFDGVNLVGRTGAQTLLLLPPDAPPDVQAAALKALRPGARALPGVPLDPDGQPLFLAYGVGAEAERLLGAGK